MSPPWSLALLLLSSLASLTSVLAQAAPSCPTTPQDPGCAAFRLSDANATAALDSLCAQMDGMPGCSIRKQCAAANPAAAAIPDPYCNPMSLLADICHVDMPTMADCKPYVSMCGSASTASTSLNLQCKEPTSAPIPALLTSKAATQNIHSICTEMSMPGCEACTINSPTDIYPRNNCDLIATYALLCKAMPDMKQCADWKTMCAATPGLSYCSSSSSTDPPVMKMFFHTGKS
ncbi:hypothetical protein PhCBS80983_g00450 [Powellomyces hirtus]|uniref:FZ domain-containing protein n=1 Tax=Powellomyces hirtus TaxID=109895 RepID=A0A507EGF4_9FUNG|nr:hypothetical protein PhCBS80983_g00450 [Powellomyces hirtus]